MKAKEFFSTLFSAEERDRIAVKGGSYSVALTAIVLAILIAVNVLAAALPSNLTSYDISASKLYSVTSSTKSVVNALEKDVTIYWIVQSGEENEVISNLLDKYKSLSAHISVEKKNPDVYPTFAAQYTDATVNNNSLVVECGEKYRYIDYSDIYLSDVDLASYSAVYSFDGEGAITSAIDFVVGDVLPTVYLLTGHGEAELSEDFTKQFERENLTLTELSLPTADEIPENAAAVLIYAPASDISPAERDMLSDYVDNGGKLMVMAGSVESGTLTNLASLLEERGVEVVEGVVVESDREHYAFGAPLVLMPEIESSSVTEGIIASKYNIIVPVAQGLNILSDGENDVTPLLMTSDSAFSKSDGYAMTSYEKESGDTDGPFALAVDIKCADGGEMIYFGSSYMLDTLYNAYSAGANLDLAMSALSSLASESEAVSIRTKSLNNSYLSISEASASSLKTLMIGVIPAACAIVGVCVILERRKKKNEQG